jgi:hypothetical protein
MRFEAEVVSRFAGAEDCDRILYAPLAHKLRYRRTRVYTLEIDGHRAAAERFVRDVLVDPVSQDVHFGGGPALPGALFHLDYGMKPGALDLEKEAVARYHGELRDPGFALASLTITQRVYVFDPAPGSAAGPPPVERFVRDVVNPAIHTWHVSDRRSA